MRAQTLKDLNGFLLSPKISYSGDEVPRLLGCLQDLAQDAANNAAQAAVADKEDDVDTPATDG